MLHLISFLSVLYIHLAFLQELGDYPSILLISHCIDVISSYYFLYIFFFLSTNFLPLFFFHYLFIRIMFHQNIGVDDMDEFPALGTPSSNNQIMQRTYASTVQDPAYHRAQSYNTPSPHFTRHDYSALTQFEPRHGVHENTSML